MPVIPRFIDEPRDWARPWIDPPGLLPKGKCCCGGGACTNVIWSDSFTTSGGGAFPSGYSTSFTGAGVASWTRVGDGGGSAFANIGTPTASAAYVSLTRPALNGLCIKVSSSLRTWSINVKAIGITIGDARIFAYQQYPSGSQALAYGAADSTCNLSGSLTSFGSTGLSGPTGTVEIAITDVSGGAGTYDISYSWNGSVEGTESGVALTIPDPFFAGMEILRQNSFYSAVGWNDLIVTTN